MSFIHPAIAGALNAFPEPVASRAERLVRALLASRADDETAVDGWRGSRLTGDGFPFELSFCTADDRLRFTLEPGPADLEARKRIDVAADLFDELHAPIQADVCEAFRLLQRGRQLKYGAWIGCRLSADDCAFKLYVEVPEGRPDALFPPPLKLPERDVIPRMVGYTLGTASFESYVRVSSLEPRHVPAVLAPAGLEDRAREVVDFIAEAYGNVIRDRLPGPYVGVSYVTGNPMPRVTLYLFARALWGADARIRRQFLQTVRRQPWDAEPYARVTAPMATRESWQTFHGLLGITLDRSSMSLAIGVRPVAP